jgi:hypothetical protein
MNIQEMFKGWQRDYYSDRDNTEPLSKSINKYCVERDMGIADLCISAFEEESIEVWDITDVANVSIGHSNINIEKLLTLFKLIYNKFSGNGASGAQLGLIDEIFKFQPEIIDELLSKLVSIQEEFVRDYIRQIYFNYAVEKFEFTHSDIHSRIHNATGVLEESLLSSIGALNYENHPSELSESLELLENKIDQNITNTRQFIANSLGCLLSYAPEDVFMLLMKLTKFKDDDTQFQLIRVLKQRKDSFPSEESKKEFLFSFTTLTPDKPYLIKELNWYLFGLVERDFFQAIDFIQQWLLDNGFNGKQSDIGTLFDTCLNQVSKHKDNSLAAVTKLMKSDNANLHLFAISLLNKFIPFEQADKMDFDSDFLALDITQTKNFNEKDFIRVCRIILGYTYQFSAQYSIFTSFMDAQPKNVRLHEHIFNALRDYTGRNYPYLILTQIKKDLTLVDNKSEKFKVLTCLKDYFEGQKEPTELFSNLKEMQQPTNNQRQIWYETGKQGESLREESEKMSLTGLLFGGKSHYVKYGSGFFHLQEDTFTEPMKFAQSSFSTTIPMSTICHPVYSELERFHFRLGACEEL